MGLIDLISYLYSSPDAIPGRIGEKLISMNVIKKTGGYCVLRQNYIYLLELNYFVNI